MPPEWKWRLYVRTQGGIYRPWNWQDNQAEVNLIHATMFTDEQREQAQGELDRQENAHIDYQWRLIPKADQPHLGRRIMGAL